MKACGGMRVQVRAGEPAQVVQGFGVGPGLLVAALGGERVVEVRQGDDATGERDGFSGQAVLAALAIHDDLADAATAGF